MAVALATQPLEDHHLVVKGKPFHLAEFDYLYLQIRGTESMPRASLAYSMYGKLMPKPALGRYFLVIESFDFPGIF